MSIRIKQLRRAPATRLISEAIRENEDLIRFNTEISPLKLNEHADDDNCEAALNVIN
jgi:hypothetical protein